VPSRSVSIDPMRPSRRSANRHLARVLAGFALVAALSAAGGSPAVAATHRIDPLRSSITFTVPYDFMIVGQVEGRFRDFSGDADLVDHDVTRSSVQVEIATASVDTDLEPRDLGLRSEYFFAAERFPTITFKSRRIEEADEGYVMVGDLTLRGVTKEARIPFRLFEFGEAMMVLGETKLARLDYGMEGPLASPDIVIGDRVTVRMSLTLVPAAAD
jgi:polyisoprenoid-binding protein YceI